MADRKMVIDGSRRTITVSQREASYIAAAVGECKAAGLSTEALEAGAVAGLVEALGSAKYVLMNKSNADMTAWHKMAEGALVDIDDALAALEPEPKHPHQMTAEYDDDEFIAESDDANYGLV